MKDFSAGVDCTLVAFVNPFDHPHSHVKNEEGDIAVYFMGWCL